MKKQKSEGKNPILDEHKKMKAWKIVSVIVIMMFILVVIGGLIKAYHFKSSFAKPTQAQVDDAEKIAAKQMQSSGANVSAFQMHAGNKMRKFSDDGVSRNIIDVLFSSNSTMHNYLIDLNSGTVLLHSETDFYGKWSNHKMYERHDLMFPKMMREK